MGVLFNAEEVFAIAIQMEANAAAFYRATAQKHDDEAGAYLLKMAEMEEDHKQTFEAMRDEMLAAREQAPAEYLQQEGGLYLSAIADGYRVEGSPAVAEEMTGAESMEDILATSCDLEKEGILFYLGLKDVVPESMGREKIDAIIEEEKQHLVTLTGELKARRSAA